MALKYAELVYDGMWFTPLREAMDAFVNATQGPVTGVVRLKLYKGNIISAGRKSPFSLYREDFATFGQEDVYDQSDAKGFIHLLGLSAQSAGIEWSARLRSGYSPNQIIPASNATNAIVHTQDRKIARI